MIAIDYMYSRSALTSEHIRPAGSGGSSMLCCSLPCGRREWCVLRHNWTSLIGRIPPRRNSNAILNKIGQSNAYLENKCSRENNLHYIDACPSSIYMYKRDLVHFNQRGTSYYASRLLDHIQGFQNQVVRGLIWSMTQEELLVARVYLSAKKLARGLKLLGVTRMY